MALSRLHHAFKHLRNSAANAYSTFAPRSPLSSGSARRRAARAAAAARGGCPAAYALEHLESRMLLTTISGSIDANGQPKPPDVFEFRQTLNPARDAAIDVVVRVKARGRITAELVGAQVSRQSNDITLLNLPGNLNGQPVFGGLDFPPAIDVIGGGFVPGIANLNISALAATNTSTFFGFHNQAFFIDPNTGQQGSAVQLIQFTLPPTGDGPVTGQIISTLFSPNNANSQTVPLTVTGADIGPTGDIIFVGQLFNGAYKLFSVRPSLFNPNTPQDEIADNLNAADLNILPPQPPTQPGAPPPPSVSTITFFGNQLLGIVNGGTGGGQQQQQQGSQLIVIDQAEGDIASTTDITEANLTGGGTGGTATVDNITGLDVDLDGNLIAVQTGDPDDELSVFQLVPGAGDIDTLAFDLGPLESNSLSSLTFVAGITDPFTGSGAGAFVAYEQAFDRFVFVNSVDRNPAQFLWNIYITDSDSTGELSIGYVRDFDRETGGGTGGSIAPFSGSAGAFDVIGVGGRTVVTAEAGTGMAFIGARSQNISPLIPDEDLIQYAEQTVPPDVAFLTLPPSISTLRPGLIVEPGNNFGKFLFGGTFTGDARFGGSLDMFYAGWLLTGEYLGQGTSAPEFEDNFLVTGDLRSLITRDTIGASGSAINPIYATGFDLQVRGTLGTVRSYDGYLGHAEINHLEDAVRIGTNQRESEFHDTSPGAGFESFNFGPSDGFLEDNSMLGGPNNFMFNDSFDTAEYIGSIFSDPLMRGDIVRLDGVLQKGIVLQDNADYYAMALMAGQTIQVRVRTTTQLTDDQGNLIPGAELPGASGNISLGVFDPDGRLIATDRNNVNANDTAEQFVGFTPDRPGIYRFAVASVGDQPDYGFVAGVSGTGIFTITPYTLTAIGVGDVAVGGIVAQSDIADMIDTSNDTSGIELFRGDFGALKAINGSIVSGAVRTIDAEVGNLRTMDAGGNLVASVAVAEGSVGLLRASSGALSVNTFDAIGGDFQLIDAPTPVDGVVSGRFVANRAIGVIRAGVVSNPIITVNADDIGNDGTIDLIDCLGDFESPRITTNTGGNVGYIRVGGQVSQDPVFGGGSPDRTIFAANEVVTLIDDSGVPMTFTPTGTTILDPNFDPLTDDPEDQFILVPRLSALTYGIRNSGGVVVIDVTSSQSLTVTANAVNGAGRAQIGRVRVFGTGRPVVRSSTLVPPGTGTGNGTGTGTGTGTGNGEIDEDAIFDLGGDFTNPFVLQPDNPVTTPPDPNNPTAPEFQDLEVILRGNVPVDVLDIFGGAFDGPESSAGIDDAALPADYAGTGNTNQGNVARIRNETPDSEMVNIQATTIGELSSRGSIGLARNRTGTDVAPITPVRNVYPFLDARNAVRIGDPGTGTGPDTTPTVIRISASQGMGNIVSAGTIAELDAGGGGSAPGFANFNGIAAPVVSLGDILFIDAGDGILPDGSGNFSRAGVYANGRVGALRVSDGNIRGEILAHDEIVQVRVRNGSIINSDIAQISEFADAREFVGGLTSTEQTDPVNNPQFEIGSVAVQGNGGIIGTLIAASDIGPIRERGGFGIINTRIGVIGAAQTFHSVRATGYGIRGVNIRLGATMRDIIAHGDGTSLSTNALSPQIRLSEAGSADPLLRPIDPFFGFESNRLTDIHAFLGTSSVQPEIAGVTDTGVIASTAAFGQRDLRTVRAWQIRDNTRLDFANSVRTLDVRDIINGLELTTGSIKKFTLNRDAFALTMNIAGRVRAIDIRGSLANNSVIRTQGPSAQIDTVRIAGNLIGNINSSRAIKSITIGGDFTGDVSVSSGGTAIKTLKVGGAFIAGTLDIQGNVGTIQSAGSLGSLGDTLTVNGNLNKLMVGGDLRSNVRVTGNLKNITVKGSIVDGGIEDGLVIDVSETISSLNVSGDIQSGVEINARSIRRQTIGGQNLGEFTIAQ